MKILQTKYFDNILWIRICIDTRYYDPIWGEIIGIMYVGKKRSENIGLRLTWIL